MTRTRVLTLEDDSRPVARLASPLTVLLAGALALTSSCGGDTIDHGGALHPAPPTAPDGGQGGAAGAGSDSRSGARLTIQPYFLESPQIFPPTGVSSPPVRFGLVFPSSPSCDSKLVPTLYSAVEHRGPVFELPTVGPNEGTCRETVNPPEPGALVYEPGAPVDPASVLAPVAKLP
jgi:hypothetical protein